MRSKVKVAASTAPARSRQRACALAASLLLACGGTTTPSTGTTPTSADAGSLRSVDWRNRTYEIDAWRVTVRDGFYEYPHDENGSEHTLSINEDVVYGDLTGDGVDEALVIVFSSQTAGPEEEITTSEGIDVSMQVLVYAQAGFGEPPRLLGVIQGGEEELRIERVAIANGVLSVFGQRFFEPEEARYRWDGSGLVAIGE